MVRVTSSLHTEAPTHTEDEPQQASQGPSATDDEGDDLPEEVEGLRPGVPDSPPDDSPEPEPVLETPAPPDRLSVAALEGVVSDSGPFGPPQAPEDVPDEIDELEPMEDEPTLIDLLPPDPLLTTALHKIVFALELVSWEHGIDNAGGAKELHHLKLEPWEAGTYRKMMDMRSQVGTLPWELQAFFLSSAALRVKMEEELLEIARLKDAGHADKVLEVLEYSAQSLERAREVDRRFRWFIDDMLFQGDTELLEQVYRSHFRFLNVFSGLWLEHQSSGGVAPL